MLRRMYQEGNMLKKLSLSTIALPGLMMLFTPFAARAKVHWHVGVGVGVPVYSYPYPLRLSLLRALLSVLCTV